MAEANRKIHWIEVKMTTSGELAEALAETLGRFVSNGVVVETVTEFNTHIQENEPTGEVSVSGYLGADEQLETRRQKLEEALWHLGQIVPLPQPSFTPIRDEDWMAAWKKHYKPILIGNDFLILPAWMAPKPDEARLVVRIDPALAFGTGTHPTTQLIMQLLEKYYSPGDAVIDVGCGSGILSIAALKMGAAHLLAVDVDSQAITSTLENAGLNQISENLLETGKGSVEEILTGRFSITQAPLVLVNILAPIVLRLFEQGLAQLVGDGGTLLLSGILEYQEADIVRKAEENGFMVVERLADEDWVSLAMQKR